MAWKFREKILFYPGFTINLSKRRDSATIGIHEPNSKITQKTATTLPEASGKGLRDRKRIRNKHDEGKSNNVLTGNPGSQFEVIEIKSLPPSKLTSDELFGLKNAIIQSQKTKETLGHELNLSKGVFALSYCFYILSCMLIFGLFIKKIREGANEKRNDYKDVKEVHNKYKLDLEFNLDESATDEFAKVVDAFNDLSSVKKIWDITTTRNADRVKDRTAATSSISRTAVTFSKGSLNFIDTKHTPLVMKNANGGDLFLYPGFIVMASKSKMQEFAIIDFRTLQIEADVEYFIEEESVPEDAEIFEYTWRYVKKDRTPDRRYTNNPRIPVCAYWKISFLSDKGLYECYQISNKKAGQMFSTALNRYIKSLKRMKWSAAK